jgi:hypothetical protein
MITRESIRLWKNSNALIQAIPHQYDDQFAVSGAKTGTTLKIRLPNDYIVRTGATAVVNDTTEQSSTLTVATQKGVDVSFSSLERKLLIDDFSTRFLTPMINNLAGDFATTVMSGIEGGASNFVSLTSAGSIISPTSTEWLLGGAKLDNNAAPRGADRIAVMDPLTQARTVSSLAGLFNPQQRIGEQYETGEMLSALGFSWMMDQTTIKHTTSTYSGTKTVNGASQTGLTITVNAITGGLNKGDIITLAGVNAVNPITKLSTGELRQFVVTANVSSGGTSIPIYPALIPAGAGPVPVQYQTVDASPADAAVITVVSASAEVYRKNFVMHKDALVIATADVELPQNVQEVAREMFDGVAMRFLSWYNGSSDIFLSRLDIVLGYLWIRPQWVCVVADKL